jgi:membrane associated rhomboid family serine protease
VDVTQAPFTILILAVTVIISVAAFSRFTLYAQLMLSMYSVLRGGEWWRLSSSALVHADWPHLLFNMFSLFSFGMLLEHAIGTWRFVLLYVLGGIVASFTSLVVHRDESEYRAVGASGAVCAVIGAVTVMYPDLPLFVLVIPAPIPAWVVSAAFIAYSILGSNARTDNIGHDAHLGGLLFGLGFVAAFFPAYLVEQWWYVLAIVGAGAASWLYVRRRDGR